MDQWVEAITLSKRSSIEAQNSITKNPKIMSKVANEYDADKGNFKLKLTNETNARLEFFSTNLSFEDILVQCKEQTGEIVSVIDGCISMDPRREDIIAVYMEVPHSALVNRLSIYWESKALEMSGRQLLNLYSWLSEYTEQLGKLFIKDCTLGNGLITLSNAYVRLTYNSIQKNVLQFIKTVRIVI